MKKIQVNDYVHFYSVKNHNRMMDIWIFLVLILESKA